MGEGISAKRLKGGASDCATGWAGFGNSRNVSHVRPKVRTDPIFRNRFIHLVRTQNFEQI